MKRTLIVLAAALAMVGSLSTSSQSEAASGVDARRIGRAEHNKEWLNYGLGYAEQRFSPLKRINAKSVSQLAPTWGYEFDTDRGQEATPIVADGVLYTTTAWSKVYAFDAKTGALKWSYDPAVDGGKGFDACCDVVNRGVAIWGGKIFVGALDGRLIALDAQSGKPVWSVQTTDTGRPYTITGAPRVVKGKVLIGNGGAEYGVRGYLSAYDAETGALAWRFYTTPNPEGKPDGAISDSVLLAKAQNTWFGDVWKHSGGGGTVWDAMAYDPKLDLLYLGVGNGSPWNHLIRSDGKGDNLFLSSIVAVKPDTGEYVWHYQTTPAESWDYTATQHIMLADLKIGAKKRRVVMQAPKNGFFYVLDAKSGALLSAEKYVPVNWAARIDMQTGRPIENEGVRYKDAPSRQAAGPLGGHNWQPMALNPKEGLVYIPALLMAGNYSQPATFKFELGAWNTGQGGPGGGPTGSASSAASSVPEALKPELGGRLIAWDPVAQKARWTIRQAGTWNSGVLATDGGLVFSGAGNAFTAYAAGDGAKLWSYDAGAGIIAAPMTYEIDREQYVALMVGMGGAGGVSMGGVRRPGRLIVFKLGGAYTPPPYDDPPPPRLPLDLTSAEAAKGDAAKGQLSFGQYCSNCHGNRSYLPNLGTSPFLLSRDAWKAVVVDGALKEKGMAGFARFMSDAEAESIRAFVLKNLRTAAAPAPVKKP